MVRARKQPRKPLCLEAVPPNGERTMINSQLIKPRPLKFIIVSFSENDAIFVPLNSHAFMFFMLSVHSEKKTLSLITHFHVVSNP